MKFKHGSRRKPIEYEKDLVKYWREHKTFEKSVEQRPAADSYVFYDGPPFITGVPHHGTLLSSVIKDAVPRYWTMKGKRVERVWGWDCHGLPAEVYTEQKLGIKDRREIGTKISLEDYIKACRENMVQTGGAWEDTIARIGRWVDFKGAYKTMDKPYMETIWWAFKKLYEAGLIYEGEKVLLYCVRDATPISKAEVAMDNSYQDITDPAVYVKFKLKDSDASLLAWTTTPWTLVANVAVAVNKKLEYAEVEVDGQKLILAKKLVDKVLTNAKHQALPYKILRSFKGAELVGKKVEPLFGERGKGAHQVYHEDFVNLEEGTGIVHSAPAYGEEDFMMAQAEGLPVVSVVDDNGYYTEGEWQGKYVWEVEKEIAKSLAEKGVVWKLDYVTHSYPHCHRCGTKLMYRAHPSWFMKTTELTPAMLKQNEPIYWFPPHIKRGRFAKNIEQAPDWNMSRDRFWATAIPVWKGTDKAGKEHVKVVGSYAELKELSGKELEDYHRPWIDDVTFTLDGVEYRRVDKVFDSWFEAGSMPFAQFHYPFENEDKFEQNFPGDFIAEYVGQVRAWFYYLHAMSVGLFGKNSFKNVIVTGNIMGGDGRKLSKSLGNYTDPNVVMDQYSADALRFVFLASPVLAAEDINLQDKDVSDVARKLAMVWNMYDFFTLYADVESWEASAQLEDPYQELTNPLDQWIISRLHQLTAEIDEFMGKYDVPGALKGVLPFIEDASNWYVRRSRRRFSKNDDKQDKELAFRTLYYLLVRLSLVLAPFTPFLAEELYRNLTGKESVHLEDWPPTGQVNGMLLDQMVSVRALVTEGLAQRAAAGINLRQPLAGVEIVSKEPLDEALKELVGEELNVKQVKTSSGSSAQVKVDTKLSPALQQEGIAREVIRQVQSYRKAMGLKVDDVIKLSLNTKDPEIATAIETFRDLIASETLAKALNDQAGEGKVKVGTAELSITITKAS